MTLFFRGYRFLSFKLVKNMFCDLHVHTTLSIGENAPEDVTEFAKRLGLGAIGIVQYYPGQIVNLTKVEGVDIITCIMIKPASAVELSDLAAKVRGRAEVLMVHGGNYEVNRAACENPLVDVLCHPELGRRDSGLDHVCVKAAHDNEVAIEINFREILETYKRNRVMVLSSMKKNVKLCKKYEARMVTASGAVTKWGMRSGRELAAVANILGHELGTAIDTVSSVPLDIVAKNREKIAGRRWEGVWT